LNGFEFIGGLATQYTKSHADMYGATGSPDNKLLNLSAYTQIENNFFNFINISIGARLEYFSLNDSIRDVKPIFRVGGSLKLHQETYLRASYGQGYRYPTIAERFIRVGMGAIGVFENLDLQPETSWNTEIGIKQGLKFGKYFGYLDVSVFLQEYTNTIEYLFGFWDPTYSFAIAGFKFLNTGRSRISGLDISLSGMAKIGSHAKLNTLIGYNYIIPKTLDPDLVFATDYNPGGSQDFSYNSTSVNPEKGILKYRFLHTVKGDIEFSIFNFSVGLGLKYFSKIENLDKAIEDFEDATIKSGGSLQPVLYMDYFNNHNNGNLIWDARLSYQFSEKHKIAIIGKNITNKTYSLRPLKAEEMQSIVLQYTLEI